MPRVPGQAEEHDLPLRSRHVSDVRRQDVRVPNLQENCREENTALLNTVLQVISHSVLIIEVNHKLSVYVLA